jgi:organic radical activating enzyme
MPVKQEFSYIDIMEFVNKFPYPIKEVLLTGGSPELHPDFIKIVEDLLKRGYFVMIFSNLLLVETLIKLPQSRRLLITASYHHTDKWESISVPEYTANYFLLSNDYRINVEEIGERRLSYSKVKSFTDEKRLKENNKMIRVSPDLQMYCTCYDMCKA